MHTALQRSTVVIAISLPYYLEFKTIHDISSQHSLTPALSGALQLLHLHSLLINYIETFPTHHPTSLK
jgi:hypothetical protein